MLSGCGIWQGMKDGTVEATKRVFYTKLKILKIDLIARNGLNQNGFDTPSHRTLYDARRCYRYTRHYRGPGAYRRPPHRLKPCWGRNRYHHWPAAHGRRPPPQLCGHA